MFLLSSPHSSNPSLLQLSNVVVPGKETTLEARRGKGQSLGGGKQHPSAFSAWPQLSQCCFVSFPHWNSKFPTILGDYLAWCYQPGLNTDHNQKRLMVCLSFPFMSASHSVTQRYSAQPRPWFHAAFLYLCTSQTSLLVLSSSKGLGKHSYHNSTTSMLGVRKSTFSLQHLTDMVWQDIFLYLH